MWCCTSKPQPKKPLRSAKQQPLTKVVLNLSQSIHLQYKKKWEGKIQPNQNKQEKKVQKVQKVQKKEQNSKQIVELKRKIQLLKKKKKKIQQDLASEQLNGKQLQQNISKAEAVATVLSYMILKKEQQIDSFVLKIKA